MVSTSWCIIYLELFYSEILPLAVSLLLEAMLYACLDFHCTIAMRPRDGALNVTVDFVSSNAFLFGWPLVLSDICILGGWSRTRSPSCRPDVLRILVGKLTSHPPSRRLDAFYPFPYGVASAWSARYFPVLVANWAPL